MAGEGHRDTCTSVGRKLVVRYAGTAERGDGVLAPGQGPGAGPVRGVQGESQGAGTAVGVADQVRLGQAEFVEQARMVSARWPKGSAPSTPLVLRP